MKNIWLAFGVLILSNCSTTSTAPDKLVMPWTESLAQGEAPLPFVAKYMREDKAMVYVAASHSNRITDPTYVLIKKISEELVPAIFLVEGFETDLGESPKSIAVSASNDGKGGMYKQGEAMYTVQLAHKAKIPFKGLEPSEKSILKALKAEGVTEEDVIHLYFLRQAPQWKRAGELNTLDIEKTYYTFANSVAKKIGSSLQLSYPQFVVWYKQKNKKPFRIEAIDSEDSAPLADGKLFTQKLSSVIGRVRDQHIVRVIDEELSSKKRIFVVVGGSHWMTQKLALESLCGFPSFEYKPY